MNLTPLISLARQWGCVVTRNAPMAEVTTFKVGGPADLLVDILDTAAVVPLIALCRQEQIPYTWLGNGSNVVVGDKGIRGAVLRLDSREALARIEGNTITAPAGITLARLAVFARDNGLTGLEFAHGIPGSLGGAVYMNAGAYGGEMKDVITSAKAVTPDGDIVTLLVDELDMGYRHTALMDKGYIVIEATVTLTSGDRMTIAAAMRELMDRRREKQPLEYPSAGSFFKRPEGHFAGALIEQAGLKGYRVGGAMVSDKHAGFIINAGGATAADICRLRDDVVARVQVCAGVTLQPEVRFIGEF